MRLVVILVKSDAARVYPNQAMIRIHSRLSASKIVFVLFSARNQQSIEIQFCTTFIPNTAFPRTLWMRAFSPDGNTLRLHGQRNVLTCSETNV